METIQYIDFLLSPLIEDLWIPYVVLGLFLSCINVAISYVCFDNETNNLVIFFTWVILWPLLVVVWIIWIICGLALWFLKKV